MDHLLLLATHMLALQDLHLLLRQTLTVPRHPLLSTAADQTLLDHQHQHQAPALILMELQHLLPSAVVPTLLDQRPLFLAPVTLILTELLHLLQLTLDLTLSDHRHQLLALVTLTPMEHLHHHP